MDNIKEIAGILTLIIGFLTTALYVTSILRGQTKPHLFTWLIWGILAAIGFGAQIEDDAGAGSWALGIVAVCSLSVVVLSFKYGERHWTISDWIALGCALGAIIPWAITRNPLLSVVLISMIDTMGYYPTFRKSWDKPWDENLVSYGTGALNLFISLFAMNQLTVISCLYPVCVVAINAVFITMCVIRRKVVPETLAQ